jgi:lysozyme
MTVTGSGQDAFGDSFQVNNSSQGSFVITNNQGFGPGVWSAPIQGTGTINQSSIDPCSASTDNSSCTDVGSGPLLTNQFLGQYSTFSLLIDTNACVYSIAMVNSLSVDHNETGCDGTSNSIPGMILDPTCGLDGSGVAGGNLGILPPKPLPPFGQTLTDSATTTNMFAGGGPDCALPSPGQLTINVSWNIEPLMIRPFGIHGSHYSWPINWPGASAACKTFAWVKASEGISTPDTNFVINQLNATAAGVPIGAYHFAHPETHPGTAGADQEASNFWYFAGCYIKAGHLMPAVDLETDQTADAATTSQWFNRWCNQIVTKAAAAGVTVRPLIYTDIAHLNLLNNTVTQWPLWIANTGTGQDPQTGAPHNTGPWPTWTVWHYTANATVPGISGNIDLDVFNGTFDDLNSLIIQPAGSPILTGVEPPGTGCIILGWGAICGATYHVQYKTGIFGQWTDLAVVTATSTWASYTDCPIGDDARFYRIMWQP